jgi:hypothetical protein
MLNLLAQCGLERKTLAALLAQRLYRREVKASRSG